MKRAIRIGVVAVLFFIGVLIARLPASWLAAALPPEAQCAQVSGTVWNGGCSALSWRNLALGNLNWRVHPRGLLSGALVSDLALDGPAGTATGQLTARADGGLTLRNLKIGFLLNPAVVPSLPGNLSGHVQADVAVLKLKNGVIEVIEGRIEAQNLEQRGGDIPQLGDYVVTFPAVLDPNANPVGDLRSVRGPLLVEGKLRLTREPGFELQGLVAAGPGMSPELAKQLDMLGAPDAEGRRPFSAAGTF